MHNFGCYTSNCFQQCDLDMIMQISTSSLIFLMFLDLYPHIDISCHYTWQLVTFPMENVVVLIRHSRLDNHLQSLLLLFDFFTITAFAFGLLSYLLTVTSTFLATSLGLSIHTRTQLHHFDSNAIALAITTFFNFAPSLSITVRAHSVPGHFHFFLSTQKYLFQSNIQFDQFRLHFLRFVILLTLVEEVKYI